MAGLVREAQLMPEKEPGRENPDLLLADRQNFGEDESGALNTATLTAPPCPLFMSVSCPTNPPADA